MQTPYDILTTLFRPRLSWGLKFYNFFFSCRKGGALRGWRLYTTKSFSRRASLTSASVIPRRIRLRTREYVLESQYILQGRKGVPQTQHPRVTRIWSADARTKTRTRFISEIRLVVLLCIAVERHCCGKCSGPEAAPLLSIVHSESWLKSRGLRSRALERKLPRSVHPSYFL